MKENQNLKNLVNRRERKAAQRRDYIRAAYYAADHDRRFGLRSWTTICVFRRPLDLGARIGGGNETD